MQTLVLLAGLLNAAPLPAAPAPRSFIVIAGISNYSDKEIPPRPDAEDDARALHELFADRKRLGASKEEMRLLLGKAATRPALLDSLNWLRKAEANDLVVFAFFGQAATIDERGERVCYLAADSTVANRARNALSAGDIEDIFRGIRSRRVCVIIETSFKGFRTKRSIAQPGLQWRPFHEFFGPGERPLPGRLVLASESRFMPGVLGGLRGEADTGDGVVTSAELAVFLRGQLGEQRPPLHILDGDGPAFPLVFNPGLRRKKLEIAPLPREDAEKYAKKVLELCDTVREEHFIEPGIARLLDLGIHGMYECLREPIPNDIARRLGRLKDLDRAAQVQLLADIRQRLGQRPELADDRDVAWTMQEMLRRFDRWSGLDYNKVPFNFGGEALVGVGLVLRKNAATDLLEVVTPLPGSPARKAGVKAGDVISAITQLMGSDRKPLPKPMTESVASLSLQECFSRLIGRRDTRMRLSIQRPGEDRPQEIEITRAGGSPETVHGWRRKRDGNLDHWLDPDKKIGYVRISHFRQSTMEETQQALQLLQSQGVRRLVLDLRYNPGGFFMAVADIASLFLKEGVVVSFRSPHLPGGKNEVMSVRPKKAHFEQSLVVLINSQSAAASEILAACLQDHKRAVIAGERSIGKGCVQNVVPGTVTLVLTTALFVRPSGKTWHGWHDGEGGVTPDAGFEVRLTRREREELWDHLRNCENIPAAPAKFRDLQLEKALEYLRR